MRKIKILSVFGTRPEVIKLAPFIKAVEADADCCAVTCASTQHRELQNTEINSFGLNVDYNLDLMRAGQDLQHITISILRGLQEVLTAETPDFVVVQGDTTTAFSSALAAFYQKIPVVHIEAGLRTNNIYNPYPEEANRQLISRLAALHMAPTALAVANLKAEGITHNVHQVGNTIVDALQMILQGQQPALKKQILITVHRRENFGKNLQNICMAIKELAGIYQDYSFIWPVHPNPNIKEYVEANMQGIANLQLRAPMSYIEMVKIINDSTLIVSDSGGIQEESCILGKPILVLRTETERPEIITAGAGILVGADQGSIIKEMHKVITNCTTLKPQPELYGSDGVCSRIIKIIKNFSKERSHERP